ncbi:gluconate 2-dehydrogenase subunit 3 family protein [Pedobacter sp.]|uniref:gluconate 2-dehydrogenase subunit 3 family protein n=1 Tax=Pedobacter sp. TaxID=1411316 RepID=UPI003D7F1A60
MDRRDAVKSVAFLLGGALSATTIGVFLEGCGPSGNKDNADLFSADQKLLITEIADIIIPTTSTPGAKAAGVGEWIPMMVKDCYPEDAQKVFVKGLEDLEEKSKKEFGNSFLKISVKEREQLLGKLRDEAVAEKKKEKDKSEEERIAAENKIVKKSEKEEAGKPMNAKQTPPGKPLFFAIMRDLTLLGYFTSEIGATQAYTYVDIPGRYDGCVDLKPGQKVWAS